MSTMFADTLLIVFISVCTALLAEGESGCFSDVSSASPHGKDPGPGDPRATEGVVASLACLGLSRGRGSAGAQERVRHRGIRLGVDFACVFVETPSSRVSVTLVEESVVLTFGKEFTAGEYKAKSRNPSLPSHHHQ